VPHAGLAVGGVAELVLVDRVLQDEALNLGSGASTASARTTMSRSSTFLEVVLVGGERRRLARPARRSRLRNTFIAVRNR